MSHRDNEPDSSSAPRRPTVVGDKYEIREEIGRGAFGQVFKAVDIKSGEVVAVKRISLAGMSHERLLDIMNEIELLKNLNHENIVKYVGSYKTRTSLDIVLEYMEQGALSQLIKKDRWGVLPESMISAFVQQVLTGLHYLHAQGVVHRDIKGANILLGAQGQVKLADFGVATQHDQQSDTPLPAQMGISQPARSSRSLGTDAEAVGTPYWMAPEVIQLEGAAAASDIWSVGAVVIELFTGAPPYFDLAPMSALYRIVSDAAVPMPEGLSKELRAFLKRCFAKDPQDRPSAGELLHDRWLVATTSTLRMSWKRGATYARRGAKPRDAHATLASVVERMIEPSRDVGGAEVAASGGAGPGEPPMATPLAPAGTAGSPSLDAPADVDSALRDVLDPATLPRRRVSAISPPPAATLPARRSLHWREHGAGARGLPAASPAPLAAGGREGASREAMSADQVETTSARDRVDSVLIELAHPRGACACVPGVSGTGDDAVGAPSPSSLVSGGGMGVSTGIALGTETPVSSGAPSPEPIEDGGLGEGGEGGDTSTARQELQELRVQLAILQNVAQSASVATMCAACEAIQQMISGIGAARTWFLAEEGTVTVMDLLQQSSDELRRVALALLLAVADGGPAVLESLCLVGVVPLAAELTRAPRPRALRTAAAAFAKRLCTTSTYTVQMFVACGGVGALVGLLDSDYMADSHLTVVALESTWAILQASGPTPKNHYCRLLSSAGVFPMLLRALASMVSTARAITRGATASGGAPSDPAAVSSMAAVRSHLDSACDLLVVLSHSDGVVKATACQPDTVQRLFRLLEDLPAVLLAKLLRALLQLTMEPQAVRQLQEVRAVALLVTLLRRGETQSGVRLSAALQLPVLEGLHNLCKVSKERQAEAASAGVTPVLCQLASRRVAQTLLGAAGEGAGAADASVVSRVRALAIGMLCALAHSSSTTRSELWTCQGLDLLVELLKEQEWQLQALDALAAWLQEDSQRVAPKLLVRRNAAIVVDMMRPQSRGTERLLRPLRDMLNASSKLAAHMASQTDLPGLLMAKLHGANAFLATCILDVIQSLYESHPRPKEFILKHKLDVCIEQVQSRHAGAIKVVDKCMVLMKAIQVNNVL